TAPRLALGQVAYASLRRRRRGRARHAVEADRACVWLVVLGDHTHGRGLAGAVRPQRTHALTAIDREGDLVDGRHAVESLGDTLDRQEGHIGSDANHPRWGCSSPGGVS